MAASKVLFTPGVLSPALPGMYSIQFDESGDMYKVDSAGTATRVCGATFHNALQGRTVENCHSIDAISGLTDALNTQSNARWISCINDVTQSFYFEGTSEIEVEWNELLNKTSGFIHNVYVNPERIQIDFTGWVALSFHINMENDENNRVLVRAQASINDVKIDESTVYGYVRSYRYVDVCSCSLPALPIQVDQSDVLQIHLQYSLNDDIEDIGDVDDAVSTRIGESHIFLKELI